MRMLSDIEYARDASCRCPFCGSLETFAAEALQVRAGCATRNVECRDCDKLWEEQYDRLGYMPDSIPDRVEKGNIEVALYECQNCDRICIESELYPLANVLDRVAVGEPMPAGECPECGAVCHPAE